MNLEDIKQATRLQPGDLLIITSKQPMSKARMTSIQSEWNTEFGGKFHMAIIDGSGFEIRVIAGASK
jgi:hypothetical protein